MRSRSGIVVLLNAVRFSSHQLLFFQFSFYDRIVGSLLTEKFMMLRSILTYVTTVFFSLVCHFPRCVLQHHQMPYLLRQEHPGGDAILRNAGGDSTAGFKQDHHP